MAAQLRRPGSPEVRKSESRGARDSKPGTDGCQQKRQHDHPSTRGKKCRISTVPLLLLFGGGAAVFLSRTSPHPADIRVVLPEREGNAEAALGWSGSRSPSRESELETRSRAAVHVVFSTDCSGYQHWQGISLWYSAARVGHKGPVTRIASGCSNDQEVAIRDEWKRIDPTGRFRVHFTPTFTIGGGYKYSNKPGGIRHWLLHANPPVREGFVCLIDPDMLLLRPITISLGYGLTARRGRCNRNQVEYVDGNGTAQLLREAGLPDLPEVVWTGSPAGQHFGFGGAWVHAPKKHSLDNFNGSLVCGDGSPCAATTRDEADEGYAVGPVYLASREDWLSLAEKWWEFVPRVHEQYPQLLAEMYGYTIAAADLKLRFSLLSSYMVSDPRTQSLTEAWAWIDDIAASRGASAVCEGADSTTLPFATKSLVGMPLPTTLHYCQNYKYAGHSYAKREVAHDFFKCDGEPIRFDVGAMLESLRNETSTVNIRTAFMLCHLIPMVNTALSEYQRSVCSRQ
uniref:Uncharacterized protein n=2 Tax=Odontella aurita TaxID=265563 RepID=A0A7S4JYN3_9STRA